MTQAVLSRRLNATPPSVYLSPGTRIRVFCIPVGRGREEHALVHILCCLSSLLPAFGLPLARLVPFMSTAGPTRRAKPAKAGGGGKAGAVVGAGAAAAAKPVPPVLPVWRRLLLRNLEWKPVRF